jgi:two-component system nitrate/nitrite response regulator NarL
MKQIKVIIADNEELFREGLARLLDEQAHIELVCQCSSSIEAIEKSRETKPDVILIDSELSDFDALGTVEEINKCSPEIKVGMFTRPGGRPGPLHVLRAGARACLAKNIAADDLIKSIELISSGRIIISPLFADEFIAEIITAEKAGGGAAETKSGLSEREIEIATLIAGGSTNKEIAGKLVIAESTVKVHVKNILRKLDLRNRQRLAAYAVLQNWVAGFWPILVFLCFNQL